MWRTVYPQGEGGSPTERTHFVHVFCVLAVPQLLHFKHLDKNHRKMPRCQDKSDLKLSNKPAPRITYIINQLWNVIQQTWTEVRSWFCQNKGNIFGATHTGAAKVKVNVVTPVDNPDRWCFYYATLGEILKLLQIMCTRKSDTLTYIHIKFSCFFSVLSYCYFYYYYVLFLPQEKFSGDALGGAATRQPSRLTLSH